MKNLRKQDKRARELETMENLKKQDREAYELEVAERNRQQNTIDLIASENLASKAVKEACSSLMMNKYSEGYPGARYYPGNEIIDEVEKLGQKRARKLFGLDDEWSVNLQPHSGSPANLAVYTALLGKNDVVLGMRLDHGGHLTHGHPASYTGKAFNFKQYGVKDDGWLDYEQVEKLAKEHKPKIIVAGYSAYSRILDYKRFRKISSSVNAFLMVDMAHFAGLVAARAYPSPFLYADIVTTTTHKTLRGPRGAIIFSKGEELSKKISRALFPGLQGGPHDNQTLAITVALGEASESSFKKYGKQVVENARVLAKELIARGITILTGGTDNHLMVVDLRTQNKNGLEEEQKLYMAGIVVSRSTVPNDPQPPKIASGIRVGTASITTRGMEEKEMKIIAEWISGIILGKLSILETKKEVEKLCGKFPIE